MKDTGELERRGENNIKMYFKVDWFEYMDWLYRANDKNLWLVVVNTVMNLRFPSKTGNLWTS
jgi:hypothetical protein